jgi:hypothetical protein
MIEHETIIGNRVKGICRELDPEILSMELGA